MRDPWSGGRQDPSNGSVPGQPPKATLPLSAFVVLLAGVAFALLLVMAPALSRNTLPGLVWAFRVGGTGMWALSALAPILLLGVVLSTALRSNRPLALLTLLLPLALPIVGWAFHHRGMGHAFTIIAGESITPLQKQRILAEGTAELGALLSFTAFLSTAVWFAVAAGAAASAIALSGRTRPSRTTKLGAAIGLPALIAGLMVSASRASEPWHWLQGAMVACAGVLLALVVLAALDADDANSPAGTSGAVALLSLGAALVSAYFASRGELMNQLFRAIGGETIDPARRAEFVRRSIEGTARLGLPYGALLAPLVALLVLLLVTSRGRVRGAVLGRSAVAIACGAAAVGALVVFSPARSLAFIIDVHDRTQPRGFPFVAVSERSIERYGGIAVYVDRERVTIADGVALASSPLEPIADCPSRLDRPLRALLEADHFRPPPLAIARDAELEGIRCAVEAVATVWEHAFAYTGLAAQRRAQSVSFGTGRLDPANLDLVLATPSDSNGLPPPFDALAPHCGTSPVELAARRSRTNAALHLTPAAWVLMTGSGEQRLTGSEETRLAAARERTSRDGLLEVSATPGVRGEWIVRALALSEASRFALNPAPPLEPRVILPGGARPEGLDGDGAVPEHPGEVAVSAGLPAEIVQRIVQENLGRFQDCHRRGLAQNPRLQGHLAVRFVIAPNGEVTHVANGGSGLADAEVTRCVLSSFHGLRFPPPDASVVTVVYPIFFATD